MNGVIIVDKPVGISSFDVIRRIKKATNIKKIGHTGTLDPLASGVLPICIGKATKLSNYLMSEKKTYRAELKLGVVTDTYDREGKILSENTIELSKEKVTEAIMSFVGEIKQIPPMYSALKINGKRLYELARQGIEVEREKRDITIYNIDIINMDLPYIIFDVQCSKGTYIRSLCYDIGEKLNVGGCMWNLRRISSGHFNIEESIELDKITKENFSEYTCSIEEILSLEGYEKVIVNEKMKTLLANGVKIKNEFLLKQFEENKRYMIYYNENEFLGLAIRENEELKMEIQF
ncbi:tRNA pseudouridine(55) synthase TruB [Clostridium grantii]|uniref:tRNA pseudouridine synthase B n=1 Tax=Clostridium grantii DSM 8605 TaxID=1121316 RepID=A0A1M5QXZ2_9CLOT|nr:tRNA pseudouridine(55) synthase TruB [Clostridium grantii]SHH18559.1 tRNA pseudouridine synthase B [Clostridium grantii DSM 8605]